VIGVVIATFGDRDRWSPLVQRAALSVDTQTHAPIGRVWVHGEDLASARNEGAAKLGCERPVGQDRAEFLVFVDADDELDAGYLEAMHAAALANHLRPAIYRPSTIGVYEDGRTDDAPCMIPRTDMRVRNCCVIGSMVPAALFSEVGGFRPYPCLEDWACFRNLIAAGAGVVDVPDAVYRVHVRGESRNSPSAEMNDTYRRILKECPL